MIEYQDGSKHDALKIFITMMVDNKLNEHFWYRNMSLFNLKLIGYGILTFIGYRIFF